MDILEIMEHLPHRYPMLLVDRVNDISDEHIVAIKNVTINEDFFQGHFPSKPVMPGVLIIEALAQAGGIMAFRATGKAGNMEDKVVFFMTIDGVKFRKPVIPGDQLILKVNLLKRKKDVWKMKGEAFVDGEMVCEAEFMAMLRDKE